MRIPIGLLSVGLVVMWSSGFIGAELGARHAPATTLLAWRFLIVAAGLLAWTLLRGVRISRRDLALHALIGGLAQVGYLYGVFAAAQHGVNPGVSSLIAALQPIVATTLAAPVLGERVSGLRAVGLVVGLGGVAIVVSGDLGGDHGAPLWAYGLPLAGMLSLVAGTLLERRTRPTAGLLAGLTVQCGISALCFTGMAAAQGTLAPPPEAGFWLAVAWVVALSTAGGYGLYWATLARTDVARVSGLLYLTPPATMAWAWLMFGDTPTWRTAAGLAVCGAAVALIRRPARRAERQPGRAHGERPSITRMPGRPYVSRAGLSPCACGSPRRPAARP